MSKTAFLYPGQGVQTPGMGADFYRNSASARAVFDEASAALGMDMRALCFENNDRLDQTEYTQAALVTLYLAQTPCADRGRDPAGCHSRIESW